jgi:hypothetical protein
MFYNYVNFLLFPNYDCVVVLDNMWVLDVSEDVHLWNNLCMYVCMYVYIYINFLLFPNYDCVVVLDNMWVLDVSEDVHLLSNVCM